jgi:hypothetical protein
VNMRDDLFSATALARRPTAVVRAALHAPVSIITPQGAVTMLRRDLLRVLEQRSRIVEDAFRALAAARAGRPAAAYPPALRWVRLVPPGELNRLAAELTAILDAARQPTQAQLDRLEDALRVWAETTRSFGEP